MPFICLLTAQNGKQGRAGPPGSRGVGYTDGGSSQWSGPGSGLVSRRTAATETRRPAVGAGLLLGHALFSCSCRDHVRGGPAVFSGHFTLDERRCCSLPASALHDGLPAASGLPRPGVDAWVAGHGHQCVPPHRPALVPCTCQARPRRPVRDVRLAAAVSTAQSAGLPPRTEGVEHCVGAPPSAAWLVP
jgi:hypothetical protein